MTPCRLKHILDGPVSPAHINEWCMWARQHHRGTDETVREFVMRYVEEECGFCYMGMEVADSIDLAAGLELDSRGIGPVGRFFRDAYPDPLDSPELEVILTLV